MSPKNDNLDLDSAVSNFKRDGFILLPGFFREKLMNHLERVIIAHFGAAPDFLHNDEFLTTAATEVIPWFPQRESVRDFDQVESDPRLDELTLAVLGSAWQRQYCMVMFSKQGTSGQAWHQDCAPENSAIYNLNRLVYTADIVDRIGGQLLLVPGSYRRGLLPVGDPHGDLPEQITLRPRKGDLVLLHGHTWHRVLPVHGGYRSSTNFRAGPADVPESITDVCVYRNVRYRFSTSEVVEVRR